MSLGDCGNYSEIVKSDHCPDDEIDEQLASQNEEEIYLQGAHHNTISYEPSLTPFELNDFKETEVPNKSRAVKDPADIARQNSNGGNSQFDLTFSG